MKAARTPDPWPARNISPALDAFQTARLRGERLVAAHLGEVRRLDTDPEVMAHLDGPRGEAATAEYMERNLRHWEETGFGVWILRQREDDVVVGRAVLRRLELEDLREVELGYALHRAWWGRGLATEVAAEIQRIALADLRLPSVVAMTRRENLRSQAVMRRIGMVCEREVLRHGVPQLLFRSAPGGPGSPQGLRGSGPMRSTPAQGEQSGGGAEGEHREGPAPAE